MPAPDLQNDHPVDYKSAQYEPMFKRLQGNILKGHGRDHSVNIFIQFQVNGQRLRELLAALTREFVTSAFKQLEQSEQFKTLHIPGELFGNLLLTRHAYEKLGYDAKQLAKMFDDPTQDPNVPVLPQKANFLSGMKAAAAELGDQLPDAPREPLEQAYLDDGIDALLLLADDSEEYLKRKAREIVSRLQKEDMAKVLALEVGEALRTDEGEGIEHFGYVDGRSQPLFLASDFKDLQGGAINPDVTTERVNDKASRRETGALHFWNPFASLDLALIRDPGVEDEQACGSYFVFRKLEQDVLHFSIREQELADKLELTGADRERAGAMAVGRFRDGTPLVLNETDGAIPAKSNDFRYDGLDSTLTAKSDAPSDRLGLKCPFQAHIRKTNPRQSQNALADDSQQIANAETGDKGRRIARRGIPYGQRNRKPNTFQVLDDLPTKDVGLLFACFQASLTKQFSFMQKTWVNNVGFKVPVTGIDPLIGQPKPADPSLASAQQHWRKGYGGSPNQPQPAQVAQVDLNLSHPTPLNFSSFIRFRGGEYFFAPSIPFLDPESSGY